MITSTPNHKNKIFWARKLMNNSKNIKSQLKLVDYACLKKGEMSFVISVNVLIATVTHAWIHMLSARFRTYQWSYVLIKSVEKSCLCQVRSTSTFLIPSKSNFFKIKMFLKLTKLSKKTDAKDASNPNIKEDVSIPFNPNLLIIHSNSGNALPAKNKFTWLKGRRGLYVKIVNIQCAICVGIVGKKMTNSSMFVGWKENFLSYRGNIKVIANAVIARNAVLTVVVIVIVVSVVIVWTVIVTVSVIAVGSVITMIVVVNWCSILMQIVDSHALSGTLFLYRLDLF